MRRALDLLYRASESMAALFVFAIFTIILAQVLFGALDRLVEAAGSQSLGLSVPAYAELSAYLLAGAMFLALAGTLQNSVHVRVSLLLQVIAPRARVMVECGGGLVGVAASGYFAWRACWLAYESWLYNDLSYGMIVTPMWLPQLPMVVGLIILTIAFVDHTVTSARSSSQPERLADVTGAGAE